jgi:hypothetical protein
MAASFSSRVERKPTHDIARYVFLITLSSFPCMVTITGPRTSTRKKQRPRVHDDSQAHGISLRPSQIRSSLRRALASRRPQSPCPVLAQRWSLKYGRSGRARARGGLAGGARALLTSRGDSSAEIDLVFSPPSTSRSCRRPALGTILRARRRHAASSRSSSPYSLVLGCFGWSDLTLKPAFHDLRARGQICQGRTAPPTICCCLYDLHPSI